MKGTINSGTESSALAERPYLRRHVALAMIVILVPLVLSSAASVAYHRTSSINARYALAFGELLGRISHLDRNVAWAEAMRDEGPDAWREEFISALGLFSALRAADPDGAEILGQTGVDNLKPLTRRMTEAGLDPFELSAHAGLIGSDMPEALEELWEVDPGLPDDQVVTLERKFGEILLAAAPIFLDDQRGGTEFSRYWAASTQVTHDELEAVFEVLNESSRSSAQAPVVLTYAVLFLALTGVFFAWIAIIRPLIERVNRIQLALAREAFAAHAADRVKTEFLASVSHELRTPMNGIIGGIQLLEASDLSACDRESLQIISDCAESQMSLIEQILTFGEVEVGSSECETTPVDLAAIVNEVLGEVAPAARKKGLVLDTDIPADVPVIESDGKRIRQIVGNLVDNAVKFTESGRVRVGVRVVPETAPEVKVQIEVADTGPGIDPEFRSVVFDRFTQVDGSPRRQTGGTGLGLAIARGIARNLGGDITLKSRIGEGSIFTVFFPAMANASRRTSDTGLAA